MEETGTVPEALSGNDTLQHVLSRQSLYKSQYTLQINFQIPKAATPVKIVLGAPTWDRKMTNVSGITYVAIYVPGWLSLYESTAGVTRREQREGNDRSTVQLSLQSILLAGSR